MDERNFERVQVDKVVECSNARGAQQVLLYNLSVDGCMIECESAPLVKGDEVTLSLTDLVRARGRVVWQAGANAGVQFSHRIHDAAVQHLGFKPSANCFDELWPVDRFGRPLARLEPPKTRLSNHLQGYQPH